MAITMITTPRVFRLTISFSQILILNAAQALAQTDTTSSSGLSPGAIAGIVIGVVIIIVLLIYFFAIRPRNIAVRANAVAEAEGGGIAAPGTLGTGGAGLGRGDGGGYAPGRIGMGGVGYTQTGWGGAGAPMMAGVRMGTGSVYAPGVAAPGMAPGMTSGVGFGANSSFMSVPQATYTGNTYTGRVGVPNVGYGGRVG